MTDTRLQQLLQMHQADPADPFLTYGIALEYGKQSQFEAALPWLEKTLALDAHYHYAYFQQAKMLSELGEDPKARAALQLGIRQAQAAGDGKALGELNELLLTLDD